jgi:hypothetical protein
MKLRREKRCEMDKVATRILEPIEITNIMSCRIQSRQCILPYEPYSFKPYGRLEKYPPMV